MTSTEPTPPKLALGICITLIACLFFASSSALVWNFRGRFPTIQILFIQNFVSLLCILPLSCHKGIRRLKTNMLPVHLLRDVMGVGSYFLYFLSIRYLNLVDATTLNYTAPFFIPFIWWIWRQEKIQSNVWWAIVLGFIGLSIILKPSKEIFQLGFVYGIFAGLTSAIALSAMRVLNLKKEPRSRTLFYYFLTGTLLSFPFTWAIWVQPIKIEWLYAIGIGVATAIGQFLLTIAYRHGTASYLSPLGYSTVIYNLLIAWILFNQVPTVGSLIGTIFIIIGGSLTYIFRKRPTTLAETFENSIIKKETKP